MPGPTIGRRRRCRRPELPSDARSRSTASVGVPSPGHARSPVQSSQQGFRPQLGRRGRPGGRRVDFLVGRRRIGGPPVGQHAGTGQPGGDVQQQPAGIPDCRRTEARETGTALRRRIRLPSPIQVGARAGSPGRASDRSQAGRCTPAARPACDPVGESGRRSRTANRDRSTAARSGRTGPGTARRRPGSGSIRSTWRRGLPAPRPASPGRTGPRSRRRPPSPPEGIRVDPVAGGRRSRGRAAGR